MNVQESLWGFDLDCFGLYVWIIRQFQFPLFSVSSINTFIFSAVFYKGSLPSYPHLYLLSFSLLIYFQLLFSLSLFKLNIYEYMYQPVVFLLLRPIQLISHLLVCWLLYLAFKVVSSLKILNINSLLKKGQKILPFCSVGCHYIVVSIALQKLFIYLGFSRQGFSVTLEPVLELALFFFNT